ncbi:hypothetical protein FHU33_0886 [Blastococcus colisei]|uniref:Uncharacterized protein n=1 Tax=Blastococcus colisei TaxID=1564162 RepID=A0A543PBR4_9ACTN|nr:hypothetical protein [Blastococcus colisei]TQN41518.1 hypothetical protein FHU33_0886 [Blastococcus colisei]
MSSPRVGLIAVGAVAVAGAAVAGYLVVRSQADVPAAVADDAFHGAPTDGVPYTVVNPPPEDPADVATDTATPSGADVRITYAVADEAEGGVAVGALVAGIIENGGECILVLQQAGRSVTTATEARADASTTTCGQLLVPFADLGSGSWTATVTYVSPAGESLGVADTTVEVSA